MIQEDSCGKAMRRTERIKRKWMTKIGEERRKHGKGTEAKLQLWASDRETQRVMEEKKRKKGDRGRGGKGSGH